MTISLPNGVKQGAPRWYGMRPALHWQGTPPEGSSAYFYVKWNGLAMYQLAMERPAYSRAPGFQWSVVDFFNGALVGREITNSLTLATANVATYGAVAGGLNTISFELDLSYLDAGQPGEPIQVAILPESEILVIAGQPPEIKISRVRVESDGSVTNVVLDIHNGGWVTPRLEVQVLARTVSGRVAMGGARSGAGLDMEETVRLRVPLDTSERLETAGAVLDWGSGNAPFDIVSEAGSTQAPWWWNFWVFVAIFTITWVAISSALPSARAKGAFRVRVPRLLGRRVAWIAATALVPIGLALMVLVSNGGLPWTGQTGGDRAERFVMRETEPPPPTSEEILALMRSKPSLATVREVHEVRQVVVATSNGARFGVLITAVVEGDELLDGFEPCFTGKGIAPERVAELELLLAQDGAAQSVAGARMFGVSPCE